MFLFYLFLLQVADALPPLHAQRICTGNRQTCIVSAGEGRVKCWGNPQYGALGNGATAPYVLSPPSYFVDVGAQVSSICCQHASVCILTIEGKMKCWGRNDVGQLGAGNTMNTGDDPSHLPASSAPIYVGSSANSSALRVVQIVCGLMFACALRVDGVVRCFGMGSLGQLGLGLGTTNNAVGDNEPLQGIDDVQVGGTVVELAAGYYHVLALLANGSVVRWGRNIEGQLAGGSIEPIGYYEHPSSVTAMTFPNNARAIRVFCGAYQSFVQCDDGNIYGYGQNSHGQLGYPTSLFTKYGTQPSEGAASQQPIELGGTLQSLASGMRHTCALTSNGSSLELRCWGDGLYGGRCSQSEEETGDLQPSLVTPVVLGASSLRQPMHVVCDYFYCYLLFSDGCLKSWGFGAFGVTGRGNEDNFCDEAGELLSEAPCLDLGVGFSLLSPSSPPSPSPPSSPASSNDAAATTTATIVDINTMFDDSSNTPLTKKTWVIVVLVVAAACVALLLCVAAIVSLRYRQRSRDSALLFRRRHRSNHSSSHSSRRNSQLLAMSPLSSSKRSSQQQHRPPLESFTIGTAHNRFNEQSNYADLSSFTSSSNGDSSKGSSNYEAVRSYELAPQTDYENFPVTSATTSSATTASMLDSIEPLRIDGIGNRQHYEQLELVNAYEGLVVKRSSSTYVELPQKY